MIRVLSVLLTFFLSIGRVFAEISRDDLMSHGAPNGTIFSNTSGGVIGILTLVQSALLKVVLPLVLVGSALYIAYQLFTAEGDEAKMKKAWKSVAYSAIALVAIALSYAIVYVLSTLSL